MIDRALVIGLDGGSWDVLAPLSETGVMPNLAALMRRSALAELRSTDPYVTPAAWSTFLTGSDPASHGVFDYRYLDHATLRVRLNDARRLRAATLLDAVCDTGGEVVSLNLPMTWPAAHTTRGIVVGGLDSPSLDAALRPYAAFTKHLRVSGAGYDLDPIWRRKPTDFGELAAGVDATCAAFHGRATAAQIADTMTDWRLMVVQFQTLDTLQHRCWHLLGVDEQGGGPRKWIDKTQAALRALDDCLGGLCELADRRNAAVIALSDHGFGPFREKICIAELLRRRGLITDLGLSARPGYRFRRTLWKLRKSWHKLARPGSSRATIPRPPEALLPVDWRTSRTIALHGELAALVYVNTPDRFGHGPLTTPRQREQALQDTLAALREATHPDTGELLFEEPCALADRLAVDPLELMLPDVLAIPRPGFHTRYKFDRAGRLMRSDPTLVATHRREGVLMVDAPGAAIGARHQANLRDVAPTLLAMLGIPAPETMTGRALGEMVASPAPCPPTRGAAPRLTLQSSRTSGDDQPTAEERLREVGYLD